MKRAKLKKAPLREVLFELFWELEPHGNKATPNVGDPGFDFALGVFASKMADNGFQKTKQLLPSGLKIRHRASYQFLINEMKWPVVQLGPGIMTVNDVGLHYEWEANFLPNIKMAFEALTKSYRKQLKFKAFRLQYINTKTFATGEDPVKFIESQLLTRVDTHVNTGIRKAVNLVQQYEQEDKSLLTISIQTSKGSKTEVIWTIGVEKAMQSGHDIFKDLEAAHNLASSSFVEMINTDLYASYVE